MSPGTAALRAAWRSPPALTTLVVPVGGAYVVSRKTRGGLGETVGGMAPLETVTATPAEVATLPAASRATAVRVWLPLAAPSVFHETA